MKQISFLVFLGTVAAIKIDQQHRANIEGQTSLLEDLDEEVESTNVETLMNRYDEKEQKEKVQEQNNLLMDSTDQLEDNDLLQQGESTSSEEDLEVKKDYKIALYQQYSEDEEGDDGLPTNNRLMNKEGCRKMAEEVLIKEKKFGDEETQTYLKLNFNRIWKNSYKKEDTISQKQSFELMKELL